MELIIITKNMDYKKLQKVLFNKFNGFGGNMNYLFRSVIDDENAYLLEFRFVYNSAYTVNSNGRNLGHSISWYDVLIMDLQAGEPNTVHYLMSKDVIEEEFNLKLI